MEIKEQTERVFDYLKEHKTATGLELLRNCGVMSYTKVISLLRKDLPYLGYTITDEWIKVKTRFNGTSRIKQYSLARLKKKAK